MNPVTSAVPASPTTNPSLLMSAAALPLSEKLGLPALAVAAWRSVKPAERPHAPLGSQSHAWMAPVEVL